MLHGPVILRLMVAPLLWRKSLPSNTIDEPSTTRKRWRHVKPAKVNNMVACPAVVKARPSGPHTLVLVSS